MRIHDWAKSILAAETIEEKLYVPELLTDEDSGPAIFWNEPSRPPGMSFSRRTREERLPPFQEHGSSEKRAICLHRFCGHELLAVEMMAFTLLAFPDAPKIFRRGLVNTLKEEQGHVRLYMDRMAKFGIRFGDLPLYRHFWKHTPYIKTPLHYLSIMSLTFEMANLDFSQMYGKSFLHYGDTDSAALMAQIFKDEISHVRFGYKWLCQMKSPEDVSWKAWENLLSDTLLSPKRAKGFLLHEEARQEAGIPEEWIQHLKKI